MFDVKKLKASRCDECGKRADVVHWFEEVVGNGGEKFTRYPGHGSLLVRFSCPDHDFGGYWADFDRFCNPKERFAEHIHEKSWGPAAMEALNKRLSETGSRQAGERTPLFTDATDLLKREFTQPKKNEPRLSFVNENEEETRLLYFDNGRAHGDQTTEITVNGRTFGIWVVPLDAQPPNDISNWSASLSEWWTSLKSFVRDAFADRGFSMAEAGEFLKIEDIKRHERDIAKSLRLAGFESRQTGGKHSRVKRWFPAENSAPPDSEPF